MKNDIENLPAPMRLYFEKSLLAEAPAHVFYRQEGKLRSPSNNSKWMNFGANQKLSLSPLAFEWKAKIKLLPFLKLSVTDTYHGQRAYSRLAFAGLPFRQEQGGEPHDLGALHRLLAEGVWLPSLLLPSENVLWDPLSETEAMVALIEGSRQVEGLFEFNSAGDIVSFYTPDRWGAFKDGFHKAPWKGEYSDYIMENGIRFPQKAKASWMLGDEWQTVWEARISLFDPE